MIFPRLSRIFYSTFFTALNIILLGLILITPGDAIRQALNNKQLYNVFVIAGCYVLTLLLAILTYASRLYTTRSVLAAIPKTWIPVERGDVGKHVRKMIADSLARSALIAWDARPRLSNCKIADPPVPEVSDIDVKDSGFKNTAEKPGRFFRKPRLTSNKDETQVSASPHPLVWGEIAHEGWSSPCSLHLPNLQFNAVILELPHLIEAKAVSLAPPEPNSSATPPLPDFRAVQLLQRSATMGLRDYTSHLTSIGVLSPLESIASFLSCYEKARFSSQPLAEMEFRDLMRLFAEILRSMAALDPAIIEGTDDESDIDGDATSTTTSESQRSRSQESFRSISTHSGSEGTIQTGPSRRRGKKHVVSRQPKLSTVPATPRGKKQERIERSMSIQSFAQTKRHYPVSQASSISLRSGSSGSVIKLNCSKEPGDLPYTINLSPSP